jgi:apolipoprotein D and lipocalin family protein
MKTVYGLLLALMTPLAWAVSKPVDPVDEFQLDRYLGRWYEIARLENKFEDGMEHITAEYSLRDDGGINVINRGYITKKKKWKTAKGKAYFVESEDLGFLKVTFFWPFYGAYVVFDVDKADYQYSVVAGPDKSYLWLLSRTPSPDKAVIDSFVEVSKQQGFDTDKLIFVNHDILAEDAQHQN